MTDDRRKAHGGDAGALGAFIAIGIGVNAALGVALDNLALWIGIGVALGVAMGVAMTTRHRRSH